MLFSKETNYLRRYYFPKKPKTFSVALNILIKLVHLPCTPIFWQKKIVKKNISSLYQSFMRAYAFITQMSEGQTSNISLLTQSTEMRKILWCPIFPFCFSLAPFLFHSICFVFVFYLSRSAYISLEITNQICKSSIATKKKCNKKSNPHFEICL